MLDIAKLLSGLMQNGGDQKPPIIQTPGINPTNPADVPMIKQLAATPGINPGAPVSQTPNILPPLGPPPKDIVPEVKPGFDLRARMLSGLKGFQAAQTQQAPPMAPMDTSQIQQLQFAHKQNGGIIPPRGRY